MRRVLVAGFFDMLHAAHVAFLRTAAAHGPLTVVIGSDAAARAQKGIVLRNSAAERIYMLEALDCVERAVVPPEADRLNFRDVLAEMLQDGPVTFVVNSESADAEKRRCCEELGASYVVAPKQLPPRVDDTHSSQLREISGQIPYRINIGGFFDQPQLTMYGGGGRCVVARIFPERPLDPRSGAATSTRQAIADAFGGFYPYWLAEEDAAHAVFAMENPPGFRYLNGTTDAIGITHPGISLLTYKRPRTWSLGLWPLVSRVTDPRICDWLSEHLWLVQTRPRPQDLPPFLEAARPSAAKHTRLDHAGHDALLAMHAYDLARLGRAMDAAFDAAASLVSCYAPPDVLAKADELRRQHAGAYLLGAGGGGYFAVASESRPVDGIAVKVG